MSGLKYQLQIILERHIGRSEPVTARELSYRLQTPERAIRLMINELIEEGLPVLSATDSPAGYFLSSNIEEAREYTRSLRSRAIEIFLRRRNELSVFALPYHHCVSRGTKAELKEAIKIGYGYLAGWALNLYIGRN